MCRIGGRDGFWPLVQNSSTSSWGDLLHELAEDHRLQLRARTLDRDRRAQVAGRSTEEADLLVPRHQGLVADRGRLAASGLVFSGTSPDGTLVEALELPGHPWFVAVQCHPEFKSKPTKPHPLFRDFVRAAVKHRLGK
jgi:CTP synthase (UTP-ammonia lyase)